MKRLRVIMKLIDHRFGDSWRIYALFAAAASCIWRTFPVKREVRDKKAGSRPGQEDPLTQTLYVNSN